MHAKKIYAYSTLGNVILLNFRINDSGTARVKSMFHVRLMPTSF